MFTAGLPSTGNLRLTKAVHLSYLAPGYLGFIEFVVPASDSRIAYGVSDAWPQPSGTFLVAGYMTQFHLPASDPGFCPSESPAPAGDPLNPNGKDPCVYTWLGDTATEVPTWHDGGLTVPPNVREVDAAGAGLIDNIPDGVTVYGVFVVGGSPGLVSVTPSTRFAPARHFASWPGSRTSRVLRRNRRDRWAYPARVSRQRRPPAHHLGTRTRCPASSGPTTLRSLLRGWRMSSPRISTASTDVT